MVSNHIKLCGVWLHDNGYSQEAIGRRLGVSQQTVSKWLSQREEIRAQNKADLTKHLYKMLENEARKVNPSD